MAFDRELADAFYTAMKGGYAPYIEDAYKNYRNYIRTISNLDYHIEYDNHQAAEIDRIYADWKRRKSHENGNR
jgi:hypothetical protein